MQNNMTIFAVDDEENILELYDNIFQKRKSSRLDFFNALEETPETPESNECNLSTFTRGEAYLQTLKSHYEQGKRVPISIIDMRLPTMHGLEIAKEARKIDPDMTIVIVTAFADYSIDELMGQLQHRVYYIRKPFKSDELYALVHSNLREWNENIQTFSLQKELAIDATQDGLWSWDPLTNTTYFSPRWKQMLGYADHEIQNAFKEWYDRVHPEDKQKVMKELEDHLKQKTSHYVNEHRLRCKDGSYKWILDRGKALFNESNEAFKMTGFHTDITERKRLEDELYSLSQSLSAELQEGISKQAKLSHTNIELEKELKLEILKRREKEEMLLSQTRQAAMGEMISMIAHQWRQPLSVIGMISNNITLDVEFKTLDMKELLESLENINAQVRYLTQTIDDFRQFFLPNKIKEEILLSESLDAALQIIGKSLSNHGIEIQKEYKDATKIALFKNELIQVFINLLKNSHDALLKKGIQNPQIVLQTKEYETFVAVSIEDNAGGIPSIIKEKIFQPYFTTKNKKNGTGLGLYISKTIIEEHSCGSIEVENTSNGAKFIMHFPKKCVPTKSEIFEQGL